MSPGAVLAAGWVAWSLWYLGGGRAPDRRRSPEHLARGRSARRWLIAAAVALAVHPMLALLVGAWWGQRRLAGRRGRAAERAARSAAVPEVADLFVVALSAGLTVRSALVGVADVAPGALADDLRGARRALGRGESVGDVLSVWRSSTHPLAPVGAALGAAERTGAASVPVLARCADQQRELARRRSEEQIRRLPVRLLGPLVLCILPALMVATFGPLALVSLAQLSDTVP